MTISIITINYNNATGLLKTIESVIHQRSKNIEYIIIDGDSSDRSKEVLEKYSAKLSYWVSEKDSGIYEAMNKGIRRSTGEFCLFLNSGDFLVTENVINDVANYLTEEVEIGYGNIILDNPAFKKTQLVKSPFNIDIFYLYKSSLWHQASFIRRSLFIKYGYYNELNRYVSDWEFFIKTILLHKINTKHIDIAISVFNTSGASWNPNNFNRIREEREKTFRKYYSEDFIDLLAYTSSINDELQLVRQSRLYKLSKLIGKFRFVLKK